MLEKEEIHTNSNHAISARLVYQYRSLFRVCHCNRRLKQSPEVFKPSRVTSTTALAIPCRWHRPAKWCKVLASCTQNGKSRKCHQFLFTTSWIVVHCSTDPFGCLIFHVEGVRVIWSWSHRRLWRVSKCRWVAEMVKHHWFTMFPVNRFRRILSSVGKSTFLRLYRWRFMNVKRICPQKQFFCRFRSKRMQVFLLKVTSPSFQWLCSL